jgi:hypothetical protein
MTHDAVPHIEIAESVFTEIFAKFPNLTTRKILQGYVELLYEIDVQVGMKYHVSLYLSGDELHLTVEHFWLEWFPCTKKSRIDDYKDAVIGFLSGRYRILEHYQGSYCIRADLQRPDGDKWERVGTWTKLHLPFPFWKTYRVVQNI